MTKFLLSLLVTFGVSFIAQAQLLVASERVLPQLKGAEVYQSEDQVIIVLDGTKITSIEQVHTIFATALNYPPAYGKNLEALREYLPKREFTPFFVQFVFDHSQQMRAQLGAEKYDALVRTLQAIKRSSGYIELNTL